ncbi:Retrovirus-related Pol polyprotein from transposon RE1 [Vitis vinifera]|uniref:Retrovirus-related Pol polyprotein from transposon RE1 n=1 Tax=Vitis vinifera TaxID=29760 RepID=A0A438GFH5_VITVI|nr:Retrovirus-related Pol polyprotein from transposon RE1 [Vitis vinifera]
MATKNPIFTSVISGSPTITSEKLIGSENYLSWSASVELWFMGQGYEDHLVTPKDAIPDVDKVQWKKIDAQLCSEEFLTLMPFTNGTEAQQIQIDKFFMVLTLIGLRPDLESIRDQILASPSVPSIDDVFAHLLRLSSTQTLLTDGSSDSSVLASQTNSQGGRSGNRGRGQRPQCTYYWYAFVCFTQSPSLGPWILDSGASDHISGNKHLFSSITTTSTLPTITLANSSKLWLKDRSTGKTIGIGRESQCLYTSHHLHLLQLAFSTNAPLLIQHRLGHPSLSKFQKMVPRFSTLSSLACESCQLGKHTRVSFPKSLNNWAKSPLNLSTLMFGDKLSAKATKCIFLGYSRLQKGYRCYSPDTHRYFLSADVTFFEDSPFFSSSKSLPISEVLPLPYISPPSDALSRPLQVIIVDIVLLLLLSLQLRALVRHFLILGGDRQWLMKWLLWHSNGTWDLVSLPPGKPTVGCRWVYTVKVGPDGQVDRLKARLVAKDCFVRLFLSMATMCHWPLYQLDIKNAFLHGELLEEVYMEQPPSFVVQGESGLVCKLRRSLYGLKQSPRAWFGRFNSVVQEFGMLGSEANHSVFYHHNSSSQCIYLVVYVDDIVITGSDQEGIQRLKQHLFNHFQTKDLGKLNYFLGLEIAQSSLGVVMSQRKTGGASKRSWEISMTCRQTKLPHHHSARHLFPMRTPGQGMLYEDKGHTQIVGYTDADWAGSPSDRHSTSRYCVFIGGNLISWKSKKQDVVVRSSTEAEYRAMALTTCELIWLRQLLQELRFRKDKQIKLVCDNQFALHIASNPVFHERTKHIEVDCHFIREKIASGCVATSFVNSNDQLADIFTKSLRGEKFNTNDQFWELVALPLVHTSSRLRTPSLSPKSKAIIHFRPNLSGHLSIRPSLSLAISHSGHQSCSQSQGRKRFPVGRIVVRKHSPPATFPATVFLHRKERLEEISNFSPKHQSQKTIHAPATARFSGRRLHLTRWRREGRVSHFPGDTLPPPSSPDAATSHPSYLFLPSEPARASFGVLLPRGPFDQFFPASSGYFFLNSNPYTCLGKCSSTFPVHDKIRNGIITSIQASRHQNQGADLKFQTLVAVIPLLFSAQDTN